MTTYLPMVNSIVIVIWLTTIDACYQVRQYIIKLNLQYCPCDGLLLRNKMNPASWNIFN